MMQCQIPIYTKLKATVFKAQPDYAIDKIQIDYMGREVLVQSEGLPRMKSITAKGLKMLQRHPTP